VVCPRAKRHTGAFHPRTRPRPAHPSGASRVHSHLGSLHVLTRAQRTRVHFYPQHLVMCHLGLYKFEFEFTEEGVGCTARWLFSPLRFTAMSIFCVGR
jgi:hypothetical protein